MPIYCYKCCQCGNTIEVIQKYGGTPVEECVECNGAMERIISPVAVIFKGSGFHKNDYKSEGRRREEKSDDKPGDTSTDKSGDASADKSTDSSTDKSGDKSGDKPAVTSSDTAGKKLTDKSSDTSSGHVKTEDKKSSSQGNGAKQVA